MTNTNIIAIVALAIATDVIFCDEADAGYFGLEGRSIFTVRGVRPCFDSFAYLIETHTLEGKGGARAWVAAELLTSQLELVSDIAKLQGELDNVIPADAHEWRTEVESALAFCQDRLEKAGN